MPRFTSLRHRWEIAALRRRGARIGGRALDGFADRRGVGPSAAIAVGRSVGNAVVRNRVRRRIRGALEASGCSAPLRLFIVARPAAAQASYAALAAEVERLVERATLGAGPRGDARG